MMIIIVDNHGFGSYSTDLVFRSWAGFPKWKSGMCIGLCTFLRAQCDFHEIWTSNFPR